MTQILVHKIPVQNYWTTEETLARMRPYIEKIKHAFPHQQHIFLPDDGSGRGGVTLLEATTSKTQRMVARRKAWQRRRRR